jgi:small subunit ribosomal protein S4
MERRLDNVVHRLGFAPSRAAARQLVLHGHLTLNGRRCSIPSLLVHEGDTIAVKVRERSRRKGGSGEGEGSKRQRNAPALVRQNLQDHTAPPPNWLERLATDPPEGKVVRLPSRSDIDPRVADTIREQLIIEFCSR